MKKSILLAVLLTLLINLDFSYAKSCDEPLPFGYSLFEKKSDTDKSDLSSIIVDDYVLKSGDEVVIDLWGDLLLHYTLSISKGGYINIPKVGRIYIQGLSFKESKAKILRGLNQSYSLFISRDNSSSGSSDVDITLGKISGVSIFVTGSVKDPGVVTIQGTATSVINAIRKAGGITPSGSLRNIEVKSLKSGKVFKFDAYDFLLNGNIDANTKYLEDGDVVFVPYKSRALALVGAVKQPGIYELLPNETINNLFTFAGGIKPDAVQIEIERREVKEDMCVKYELDSYSMSNLAQKVTLPLLDGDKLVVYSIGQIKAERAVFVKGEVNSHGKVIIPDHADLELLIRMCNGFKSTGEVKSIEIIRNLGKDGNRTFTVDYSTEKGKKFILLNNDIIYIKPCLGILISVVGNVNKPGQYFYKEGKDYSYYLDIAGGVKNSDKKIDVKIKTIDDEFIEARRVFLPNPEVPMGSTLIVN